LCAHKISFVQHDDDDDDKYENFYGAITQHMPLQMRLDKDRDTCERSYILSELI